MTVSAIVVKENYLQIVPDAPTFVQIKFQDVVDPHLAYV